MTTPEIVFLVSMLSIIGVYLLLVKTVARWAASRYAVSEKMAGHAFGILVFIVASFVWAYFDIAGLLESYGIQQAR